MEYSRFFASVGGDRMYSADDINKYLYEMLEEQDGVLQLASTSAYNGLLALSNAGTLSVDIATGAATKTGALYFNDASLNKPLAAVTSGLKRYDRIVLRKSASLRNMAATVVQGTESATPALPAIVAATDVLLGNILIDRSTGTYVYTVTDERQLRPFVYTSPTAIASLIHAATANTTLQDFDEVGVADSLASFSLKKITWANIATWIRSKLSNASTAIAGVVQFASTGVQDATKAVKATGAELAALLTAGGFSLSPATGTASLDNIADGTTYKRILAAIATALNAGTYDAPKCTTFGVGGISGLADNYDIDTLKTNGRYAVTAPFITGGGAFSGSGRYNIDVAFVDDVGGVQIISRAGSQEVWIRLYDTGVWLSRKIWNGFNDGNGGQPPQAKGTTAVVMLANPGPTVCYTLASGFASNGLYLFSAWHVNGDYTHQCSAIVHCVNNSLYLIPFVPSGGYFTPSISGMDIRVSLNTVGPEEGQCLLIKLERS